MATVPALVWDIGGLRASLAVDYTLLVGGNIILATVYLIALYGTIKRQLWGLIVVIGPALFYIIAEFVLHGFFFSGLRHRRSTITDFGTSRISLSYTRASRSRIEKTLKQHGHNICTVLVIKAGIKRKDLRFRVATLRFSCFLGLSYGCRVALNSRSTSL